MKKKKQKKFYEPEEMDLLAAYINDCASAKSKPLSQEEEKILLQKYYSENTKESEKNEIKKKIVISNLRFIYDLAKCYCNNDKMLLLELINVGTIGLYETFDNFDISKDYKFITYAQYYIRRAINRFIYDENLIVKPSNNAKLSPKIKRIEEDFYIKNGRKPTIFEIEDELLEKYNIEVNNRNDINGVTIEHLDATMDDNTDKRNYNSSIDKYTFEKSKEFTDYISIYNDYDVQSEKNDISYFINKLITRLPEREATIIKMAYGIGNYMKPYNNQEIGEALNITPERVRQLKKIAETKLKSLCQRIER